MKLLLDIGNTRIKWALRGEPSSDHADDHHQQALLRSEGEWLPPIDTTPEAVWISSVAGQAAEREIAAAVHDRWNLEPWFARTQAQALGLKNSYADPSQMGVDRWLAMLAAWRRVNGQVCVVDAGSALTIDLVSAAGEHLGGYILPGLDSMQRALFSDTDRVRFDQEAADSLQPGHSTAEAVHNGLLLSQAGAVVLAIDRHASGFPLIVTGGNGDRLLRMLDGNGDFIPNLVLEGLAIAPNW